MTLEKEGYTHYEYKQGIDRVLKDLANVFHLSERPLYEHARAGRIIGVNYDHGTWHFSVRPGFEGPVPDIPQEYLVPPGELRGVFPLLLSGEKSGPLFVGTITTTEKKNLVELYGIPSGIICRPLVDYY